MSETQFGLMHGQERSHWIRLRTLILLRWVAIAGQIIAILVAQYMYNLQLVLPLCFLAVGIAVTGNLVATLMLAGRPSPPQVIAQIEFALRSTPRSWRRSLRGQADMLAHPHHCQVQTRSVIPGPCKWKVG